MRLSVKASSRLLPPGAVVGVIAVALGALPFWVTIVPPLDDMPAHILVARILSEYQDPDLRFAEYFSIEWALAPTSLFYVVMAGLQRIVGPVMDARIYLTVFVAGMWLSVSWLARVLGASPPWLTALMTMPIVFCWYVYNGFLPFLMSLPLFVASIAAWYSDWRASIKLPLLWILLACLFGFHIVGAAAAGAVITTAACIQYWCHGRQAATLGRAFLALTPLIAMTAVYLLGQSQPRVRPVYSDPVAQVVDAAKFTVATLDEFAALLLALWLITFGLVLLWRWRDIVVVPHVTGPALLLLFLAVAMPQSMGALWPAGPRLLPFALVMLFSTIRWSALPRSAASSGLALMVGLSALTVRQAMQFDQGYRDTLAAANEIRTGMRVLTIIDSQRGPRWTMPYRHLGALVTTFRGGSNPFVFAAPTILTGATPLRYRQDSDAVAYAFPPDQRRSPLEYAGVSGSYDYVLLLGSPHGVAEVLEQEMTKVSVSGLATVYARADGDDDPGRIGFGGP
jgi:hypothetical protein